MAQYFFLASSLPALQFGNAMPITLADFHDRCASAMPQDEFELLKRTELLPGDISGFCSNDLTVKFWIWETYSAQCAFASARQRQRLQPISAGRKRRICGNTGSGFICQFCSESDGSGKISRFCQMGMY